MNMVRTCPEKTGKSWNLRILNSKPGKSCGKTPQNPVSPGKVLEFHLTSHLNLFWLKQQDLRPELQVSNYGIIYFRLLFSGYFRSKAGLRPVE